MGEWDSCVMWENDQLTLMAHHPSTHPNELRQLALEVRDLPFGIDATTGFAFPLLSYSLDGGELGFYDVEGDWRLIGTHGHCRL